MAFFTLCDQTSSVKVNCFTGPYATYAPLIQPGQVVKIYGKIKEELKYNQENEKELIMTVKTM